MYHLLVAAVGFYPFELVTGVCFQVVQAMCEQPTWNLTRAAQRATERAKERLKEAKHG